MTYTYCCVYRASPDDGQRNCPKHVEFYSKNKSEKLVHLIGYWPAVSITHTTYTYCCVYSARLLMMDGEIVRNM